MVERAIIEKRWHETTVAAEIHALIGDNSHGMVDRAGRVLYVMLGACVAEEADPDMPEVQTIRSACGALYEQAGEEAIRATRRASIVAGLEAAGRLIPLLMRRSLTDAACDLTLKTRGGDVRWSDFQQLLRAVES